MANAQRSPHVWPGLRGRNIPMKLHIVSRSITPVKLALVQAQRTHRLQMESDPGPCRAVAFVQIAVESLATQRTHGSDDPDDRHAGGSDSGSHAGRCRRRRQSLNTKHGHNVLFTAARIFVCTGYNCRSVGREVITGNVWMRPLLPMMAIQRRRARSTTTTRS